MFNLYITENTENPHKKHKSINTYLLHGAESFLRS